MNTQYLELARGRPAFDDHGTGRLVNLCPIHGRCAPAGVIASWLRCGRRRLPCCDNGCAGAAAIKRQLAGLLCCRHR